MVSSWLKGRNQKLCIASIYPSANKPLNYPVTSKPPWGFTSVSFPPNVVVTIPIWVSSIQTSWRLWLQSLRLKSHLGLSPKPTHQKKQTLMFGALVLAISQSKSGKTIMGGVYVHTTTKVHQRQLTLWVFILRVLWFTHYLCLMHLPFLSGYRLFQSQLWRSSTSFL